jgi:hypothetical protein
MSRSTPLQRKPDRERGDVDLVLVMATLGVLVWVLGPWLVAIVQALDATEELTQVAWSLARRAELTATPPPPTVTVPGLGEVQVDWRGTLGRCGMVTVVARSALPLPLRLDVLATGSLAVSGRATVAGDAFTNGQTVGSCGAL